MDMFDKSNQQALKEEYKNHLSAIRGGSMLDYCLSQIDVLAKTSDGYIIELEKEGIEKHFCFGYSLSSHDSESFDNANRCADMAKKSEEYFIEENLKKIKQCIKFYSDKENDLYFVDKYYDQKTNVLKSVIGFRPYDDRNIYGNLEKIEVSDEDRELIVAAYQEQLKKQEKKVRTYLKRFGLSKVRTWSYWQDA